MKPEIILADDDVSIRTVIAHALQDWDYKARLFDKGMDAVTYAASGQGQIMILDVMLPDSDGLELVSRLRKERPDLPVIIISAQNNVLTALRAGKEKVFDYLPKPFDLDHLRRTIERALPKNTKSQGKIRQIPEKPVEKLPMIGHSSMMQNLYRQLAKLIGTDMTVLIEGESGTGKELVARTLHDFGKRRDKAFVPLNMAAIPKDLIESELFGYDKGAFTGATESKAGKFLQAQGGTIFLDEIGDMPYEAQTRLLRILQSREYSPIGSHRIIKIDCRIIAATHRHLPDLVKSGKFREDLYYRLSVIPLTIPPLRERSEDIPDLVAHFCNDLKNEGQAQKQFTPAALSLLTKHSWPGNVRELENLVRRLSVLTSDWQIDSKDVMQHLKIKTPAPSSLGEVIHSYLEAYIKSLGDLEKSSNLYEIVLKEVEAPLLSLALQSMDGNQIKAAALLGINRNTLRKKLRELNIMEK